MMKMKQVILILITTIFGCNSSEDKNLNENKTEALTISTELGSVWKADSTFYSIGAPKSSWVIDVRIVFNNETNDTISYQSMSCSFPDEFSIDDSINFGILPSVCFGNVPITVSIPPKRKTDRLIRVFWNKQKQKSEDEFKIGLKKEELNNGKIIWSNPIKMKRLYQQIYK